MQAKDLPTVLHIAAVVHPHYPEHEDVFAERLALYPGGCLCLALHDDRVAGYVLSHPWHADAPPALDALLQRLPVPAPAFYLHDMALLPEARGVGAAGRAMPLLATQAVAAGCRELALVAVNDSAGFWARQGFYARNVPALAAKLATYDAAARFMVRPL
ncbi:GNAT family N-acetyltransferase [uncultured Pseudacidovorax sp.]|uniref:GNAT family N-acetyltransferase n=1 Tax=uncultured Pseudacidovorax sp. TaxID=679313 RepID=UPI0025DE7145|nr:GNAT family N-acetyltransferase [uncultured Pseudacidovorax sp.]